MRIIHNPRPIGPKPCPILKIAWPKGRVAVTAGLTILCTLWLLLGWRAAIADDHFPAEAVEIIDGDSFWVVAAGRRIEIRLWGVDCPEWTQPYSQEAQQLTSQLLIGKEIVVQAQDTDVYGRTVAQVFVGRLNVNEELVRQGAAWVFTRYCRQPICEQWLALQQEAQQQGTGLWSLPHPEPPWAKRRGKK